LLKDERKQQRYVIESIKEETSMEDKGINEDNKGKLKMTV
jgi:hypothetical protein